MLIIIVHCVYRPGHSLTFFSIISSVYICVSVLIRGVQPYWASIESLQNICQVTDLYMYIYYYGSNVAQSVTDNTKETINLKYLRIWCVKLS